MRELLRPPPASNPLHWFQHPKGSQTHECAAVALLCSAVAYLIDHCTLLYQLLAAVGFIRNWYTYILSNQSGRKEPQSSIHVQTPPPISNQNVATQHELPPDLDGRRSRSRARADLGADEVGQSPAGRGRRSSTAHGDGRAATAAGTAIGRSDGVHRGWIQPNYRPQGSTKVYQEQRRTEQWCRTTSLGVVWIRSGRQRRRVGVDCWSVSSFRIWVWYWIAPFGIWCWVGQRIHNAWAVDRRWPAECRGVVPDEGPMGEQWCQTK